MPTLLWTTWERTVSLAPDAPAVIDARDGRSWTRRELSGAAAALAQDSPAEATSCVVAFAEVNHPRWMAIFLMLQRLGAVALPLDAALPFAQQAQAAANLGAGWLLQNGGTRWTRLSAGDPILNTTAPRPGNCCLIKTTSGSTGQPQALAFTSENMLADGRQIISTMGIGTDDRNLGAIPFGHSYGLGNLVMPLILQGTQIICSTEILPSALVTQIERFSATVLPSVPVVLRALAESISADQLSGLRSLRRVISAGAPLRPEVAGKFQETVRVPVQNFYGSSETGGICFDRTGEATLMGRSIGKPLDGVAIRLNDESRVIVRSPAVMLPGEWTLPDLGAWTEHGELVLTGRAAPLVNIGGKKVAPLEIERALCELEGVSDAWVGVQTRGGAGQGSEEFLFAAVETGRSREEILRVLAERLPAWQIPRRLRIMARLPRTERGKLDRPELERLARE